MTWKKRYCPKSAVKTMQTRSQRVPSFHGKKAAFGKEATYVEKQLHAPKCKSIKR